MSNKTLSIISIFALIVSVVVGIMVLVGGNQPELSISGTRFPNGISADSTAPSAGQVRGTTLTTTGAATLGGDTTITTSNTATSTLIVGAIQMYATSTATAACLRLVDQSTATASSTGPTGASFVPQWSFGTCP